MLNEVDVQPPRETLPVPAVRNAKRERLSWVQLATLIAFILCAAGLLAAVAEVARTQFTKGLSFSFAVHDAAPAPEPYVSRGVPTCVS